MGADGGSFPKREEIVRTKPTTAADAAAAANAEAAERARWSQCALSHAPLSEPIVADAHGRLFNKDAILRALLAKTLPAPFAAHIRGLRDLFPARLTRNPATSSSSSSASWPFICPVTRREAGAGGARGRMVLLRPCGCCVAESVFSELPRPVRNCPACSDALLEDAPPIVLNGTAEDIASAAAASKPKAETKKKKSKRDRSCSSPPPQPPAEEAAAAAKRAKKEQTAAPAMPKGASESVYRSLFHAQQSGPERSEDLFLHKSGAGGPL